MIFFTLPINNWASRTTNLPSNDDNRTGESHHRTDDTAILPPPSEDSATASSLSSSIRICPQTIRQMQIQQQQDFLQEMSHSLLCSRHEKSHAWSDALVRSSYAFLSSSHHASPLLTEIASRIHINWLFWKPPHRRGLSSAMNQPQKEFQPSFCGIFLYGFFTFSNS